MSGPAPEAISVTSRQRRVLERLTRRASGPQQQARRARVVLAAAAGKNNAAAGRQAGMQRDAARCWRERWQGCADALLAAELEGGDQALEAVIVGLLADHPRSGTPATFTPEQICQIMALACEPPEASGRPTSHWTARELALEAVQRGIVASISQASVDRFLKSGGHQATPKPVLAHADAGR
jgi:putative transposase